MDLSDKFDVNYPNLAEQIKAYFLRDTSKPALPAAAAAAAPLLPTGGAAAAAPSGAAAAQGHSEQPPNYIDAVRTAPLAGAAAAVAAPGLGAAAAAGGAEGVFRPDSIKKLLTVLELEEYIPKFKDEGINSVRAFNGCRWCCIRLSVCALLTLQITDVALWTQEELVGIGMKKGEAKRLLAGVAFYK